MQMKYMKNGEHTVRLAVIFFIKGFNLKETDVEQDRFVKNVFKNEKLTMEAYTRIWIELISSIERSKTGVPTENYET